LGRTEGFTLTGLNTDDLSAGQIVSRMISGHDGDKLLAVPQNI
jgi:threonylcarbamoyladenosine tRNA methylthiotransferase MtaB